MGQTLVLYNMITAQLRVDSGRTHHRKRFSSSCLYDIYMVITHL